MIYRYKTEGIITKIIKKAAVLVLISALAAALVSCAPGQKDASGTGVPKTGGGLRGETETRTPYTDRQMYILLSSERDNISSVYTDRIFDVVIDNRGDTYRDSYLEMMRKYIIKLDTLREMCTEQGTKLTAEEKKAAETVAGIYMKELGKNGNETGITQEEVTGLISDQLLIQKLRNEITGASNLEVSESEARVMNVSMMVLSNQDDADRAAARILEGEDFLKVARESSIEADFEKKVSREDLDPHIVDTVFSLEDGQLSSVMDVGGRFYIVMCNKEYDPEATALHKEKLIRDRISEAVGTVYEEYSAQHQRELDVKVWQSAVSLFDEQPDVPNIYVYIKDIQQEV